jgi:hypothetical protein
MKIGVDMDRIEIKIEVTDYSSDGAKEVTKIEKFTATADGQLVELVDIFAKFMNIYGFLNEVVSKGFKEWIEEYENEK